MNARESDMMPATRGLDPSKRAPISERPKDAVHLPPVVASARNYEAAIFCFFLDCSVFSCAVCFVGFLNRLRHMVVRSSAMVRRTRAPTPQESPKRSLLNPAPRMSSFAHWMRGGRQHHKGLIPRAQHTPFRASAPSSWRPAENLIHSGALWCLT